MIINDNYVTELNFDCIENKKDVSLFNSSYNEFSPSLRNKVIKNAIKLFNLFDIKDYARFDFFIEDKTNEIYFNEINTQPFFSDKNIKLMKKDGYPFSNFIELMIKKNLKE